MRFHPPDEPIQQSARGAAVALGNFDGVHVGHAAVVASARDAAQRSGAPLGAAVFAPHPRRLFQPDAPAFLLQSAAQRARALEALGVAHLYEIRFDRSLAAMTDAEFCEQVLQGRLGVAHVSVGFDFRFGRGRMGDVQSLAAHGARLGFSVDIADAVDDDASHEKVSSSAIRSAVRAGAMDEAAHMLGRPWAVEGVVQQGFQRGRALGAPTANLALDAYVRPRLGIYAARADIGAGALREAVVSVGVNPTTGTLPEPVLEAHLLDFDGDLYGKRVEIQFAAFLRDEAKFDTLEALQQQIGRDVEAARAALRAG